MRTTSAVRSSSRSSIWRSACIGAVAVLAIAACGSDDDEASAEEQFCAAGDALEADITGLANVDVVAGGTDALTEQFDAVQDDVSALRDAGADVAEDELDALDSSVSALGDAIDSLAGEITSENATAVVSAIGDVSTSATAVYDVLANTCA